MSSNGKWNEFKFEIFIDFRDAIDNEAEPNANRNQEGRQSNRAAREEGKSEQPKNKKKVHTIKNQSNIKKDTIKMVSQAPPHSDLILKNLKRKIHQ